MEESKTHGGYSNMSAAQIQQDEPLKIQVHVRDQHFTVFCGAGTQKIRWLSDVALHRYQHFHSQDPGLAKGMRFENGQMIDMEQIICRYLEQDQHVWVILKEDLALMEADSANQPGHFD